MRVKRKYLNDLLVYLQKTYGLYFVEFRKAPNGRKEVILCHPKNKDWWISVLILNLFEVSVTVACAGENGSLKKTVIENIKKEKYKGYGNKYIGKWLRL